MALKQKYSNKTKEVKGRNLRDPINLAPWNSLGTPSCVVTTITYNMHK